MELNEKNLDPMKFSFSSRYKTIEEFMVLNSILISLCQEIQKLYYEDYDFMDFIYERQNTSKEYKKQYFKQLLIKKLEIEKYMHDISIKLGVFQKYIAGKGWKYFDDVEDL